VKRKRYISHNFPPGLFLGIRISQFPGMIPI